jgi:glycosyltransferase involved in cell wall biosynthesis
MIVLMKSLDEENSVNRCISDFHDEPFCEKIIVIDGGSTDYTVQELLRFKKVSVYVHPWLDWYHDMEVCQSNIALSYVPNGAKCIILDFDEQFSSNLKGLLNEIDEKEEVEGELINIARETNEVLRFPDSPFAMLGKDGNPFISHRIGQFPDYQPRLITKTFKMKWVNSPHHQLIGFTSQKIIDDSFFIIHYEKDDYRKRTQIERKWLRAQARRKELGLTADVFECRPKTDICEYAEPEGWIGEK